MKKLLIILTILLALNIRLVIQPQYEHYVIALCYPSDYAIIKHNTNITYIWNNQYYKSDLTKYTQEELDNL